MMSVASRLLLLLSLCVIGNDTARILAFYPTPLISHQVFFRHLTRELLKRGHELVVLTPDPMFKMEETPANLTEINLHDVSYEMWKKGIETFPTPQIQGDRENFKIQLKLLLKLLVNIVEKQLSIPEVQAIINDKTQKFDLVLLEAYIDSALGLSHVFKAPIIQFSSVGATLDNLEVFGAPIHPFLYPTLAHMRILNLSFWEKLSELRYFVDQLFLAREISYDSDQMLKRLLGSDVPSVSELKKKVDMLFLDVYSMWDFNRPVPPNVILLGGIHQNQEKELPKDLKLYLDSSKNGVIYVSFGTNADAALLPAHKIQTMVKVFSKLQYDVLWKWNTDELPGRTENIKISKWLPQADLLKHPKIKLFITQGGMQSTDEAIDAGVPLIGIPMIGDQWYNVEHYVHLEIGLHVDIETITEETFRHAIENILQNDSYRQNIIKLRTLIRDQPQSPLEKAVWWTEYVIRHGGAKHLRSPAAGISWAEYLELELVLFLLLAITAVSFVLIFICYKLYKILFSPKNKNKKVKKR